MSRTPARALLVFVDGFGLGAADARVNPLAGAHMPRLTALLGGALPVLGAQPPAGAPATITAADATLGLDGTPQSGTGQTSLLTGYNAGAIFGRHFGPWVPVALREMLSQKNLLTRAAAAGRKAAFANAYPLDRFPPPLDKWRRPAAPPLAAAAAGALVRGAPELHAGLAVASSITNAAWRQHLDETLPRVSAQGAGSVLGRIAGAADLTLFAHYDLDTVGHKRQMDAAVPALRRLDRFIGGLVRALPPDTLLVISSDHGNVEDVRVGHTRNPVPAIAFGPGAEVVRDRVHSIEHVVPCILNLLGISTT